MFVKLVRIGRDAELRYTPAQKAVINLACVYDIGWGDNKKSQWIDATVWGKQAEALAQYLPKGKQVVISAEDIELEEFQKKDQTMGSKLKCRVFNIDLTDNKEPQGQPQGQQAPQQQGQQQGFKPQQQQKPQQNFEQGYAGNNQPQQFEDDQSIPF